MFVLCHQMADIQQRHQLAMKQLTEQHTPNQSERDITQFKSQLATQQVSKRHDYEDIML